MTIAQAYGRALPAEVTFSGTVTSRPSFFYGTRTRCEHEQFDVRTSAGPVRVIDNVALAPPIPVRPGDVVRVRGEMVHDAHTVPIVHWTHHDPQHIHPDGFIETHGRRYA